MSIYIGNDLEDRLEALEVENASLRKYNEYHQVVHEIDHMSDLHLDSSFYKQSMKLDNYFNPISTGGGVSTPRPVNGSELRNGTS